MKANCYIQILKKAKDILHNLTYWPRNGAHVTKSIHFLKKMLHSSNSIRRYLTKLTTVVKCWRIGCIYADSERSRNGTICFVSSSISSNTNSMRFTTVKTSVSVTRWTTVKWCTCLLLNGGTCVNKKVCPYALINSKNILVCLKYLYITRLIFVCISFLSNLDLVEPNERSLEFIVTLSCQPNVCVFFFFCHVSHNTIWLIFLLWRIYI
jgi:hypothetical protein